LFFHFSKICDLKIVKNNSGLLYLCQKDFNMFTTGQLVFAGLFLVAFIITMVVMYRKDLVTHKKYYKGTYKILLGFLTFIALLFVIKTFLKE